MEDLHITHLPPKIKYGTSSIKKKDGNVKLNEGWFALRHQVVRDSDEATREDSREIKKKRRQMYGKWYAIQCKNRKIFRLLRFSSNIDSDRIVLDWYGWQELSDYEPDKEKGFELKIRPVTAWEYWWGCCWNHPNASQQTVTRTAMTLGAISVGLGFVSIVLAVIL